MLLRESAKYIHIKEKHKQVSADYIIYIKVP